MYDIAVEEREAKVFKVKVPSRPIRRGQIRWCSLEADKNGKTIGKRRPCIIIQSGKWNNTEDCTIGIIPLSHSKMYNSKVDDLYALDMYAINPNSYFYRDENQEVSNISYICLNRMMFISRQRVSDYIGETPKEVMDDIITPYIMKRFGIQSLKKTGGKKNVRTEDNNDN